MRGKNTIFINGQHYDAVTGLPIEAPQAPKPAAAARPVRPSHSGKVMSDVGPMRADRKPVAKATPKPVSKPTPKPAVSRQAAAPAKVHAAPQRSKTLRRDLVKRPSGTHETVVAKRDRVHPSTVIKSPVISRFASHPMPRISDEAIETSAVLPVHKPVIVQPATVTAIHQKVAAKTAAPAKKAPVSSRQLKEHLIAEKLASVETHKKATTPKKHSLKSKIHGHKRPAAIVAACLALVVLGGYLTYLNMPSLSVRVAAAQAGINASFPEYRPDGYRFNGPIAYSPGEVTMNFKSTSGDLGYEIKQKASSWDSQAVLDNYVLKESDSYLTYSEQGLTIYTYNNHAAWVNGGVLYTLDGNAPLSNEQVLRIASSM